MNQKNSSQLQQPWSPANDPFLLTSITLHPYTENQLLLALPPTNDLKPPFTALALHITAAEPENTHTEPNNHPKNTCTYEQRSWKTKKIGKIGQKNLGREGRKFQGFGCDFHLLFSVFFCFRIWIWLCLRSDRFHLTGVSVWAHRFCLLSPAKSPAQNCPVAKLVFTTPFILYQRSQSSPFLLSFFLQRSLF